MRSFYCCSGGHSFGFGTEFHPRWQSSKEVVGTSSFLKGVREGKGVCDNLVSASNGRILVEICRVCLHLHLAYSTSQLTFLKF